MILKLFLLWLASVGVLTLFFMGASQGPKEPVSQLPDVSGRNGN